MTIKITLRDNRYMTFTCSPRYGGYFLAGLDEIGAAIFIDNEVIPKRDIASVVIIEQ